MPWRRWSARGPSTPTPSDPTERRLRNVIEEMALAAGIPAPRAYVLDSEEDINAFAAGTHAGDAVVAVTRGALQRLTRDELQGVIGHEFSHILNGDMGLNVRLIGVLQGLLMLALFGRFLMSIGQVRERCARKRRARAVRRRRRHPGRGLHRRVLRPPDQGQQCRASANSWPTPAACSSRAIPTASAAPCARSAAWAPTPAGSSATCTPRHCRTCSWRRSASDCPADCWPRTRRWTSGCGASTAALSNSCPPIRCRRNPW